MSNKMTLADTKPEAGAFVFPYSSLSFYNGKMAALTEV
jgi:hypothetical protein